MTQRLFVVALTTLMVSLATAKAYARSAQCFTSDDGYYACDFQPDGKDGSFDVSYKGKPTIILMMESQGRAWGYADFGTGRNVNLPGIYIRSVKDGACWVNDSTKDRLCVY